MEWIVGLRGLAGRFAGRKSSRGRNWWRRHCWVPIVTFIAQGFAGQMFGPRIWNNLGERLPRSGHYGKSEQKESQIVEVSGLELSSSDGRVREIVLERETQWELRLEETQWAPTETNKISVGAKWDRLDDLASSKHLADILKGVNSNKREIQKHMTAGTLMCWTHSIGGRSHSIGGNRSMSSFPTSDTSVMPRGRWNGFTAAHVWARRMG